MSEKFLQLAETIEQETTRRALGIVAGAVRGCDSAIKQIKILAANRGGKTAFLAELGDTAIDFVSACQGLKALVEKLSDLTVNADMAEAPG